MKLIFKSPYKSVKHLTQDTELPDLSILIGRNGAGKSHILQAIHNGSITIRENSISPAIPNTRLLDWSSLTPNNSQTYMASHSLQERSALWEEFKAIQNEAIIGIHNSLSMNPESYQSHNIKDLINKKYLIATGHDPQHAEDIASRATAAAKAYDDQIVRIFTMRDPQNRERLISGLRSSTNTPLSAFDEDDFFVNFPIGWRATIAFQQEFSTIFCDYQHFWKTNKLKQWMNEKGSKYKTFTDDEFEKKYGPPPWEIINSALESSNLNYEINKPNEFEDRPFTALLKNKKTGAVIQFDELSSGEKILFATILCIYHNNNPNHTATYPPLLLFDEIDAPLHPSMTQLLLRTIKSIFIEKLNLKVILTTHSPTTVALAPEESLFSVDTKSNIVFNKITKDQAISTLLSDVPSINIHHENRRQVFVESHYDAKYFELLYKSLKSQLISEISINFIASSKTKSGCDHVKEVVKMLVDAGNASVFGIIDWDTTNSDDGHIFVLGNSQRHSIENYLLDPLLISNLLLREKLIDRKDIGLKPDESHMSFTSMDNLRLQQAANFVIEKLKANLDQPPTQTNVTTCEYTSNIKISIPEWYLLMKGHDLECKLKNTFSSLKMYHREPDLKFAILKKVGIRNR